MFTFDHCRLQRVGHNLPSQPCRCIEKVSNQNRLVCNTIYHQAGAKPEREFKTNLFLSNPMRNAASAKAAISVPRPASLPVTAYSLTIAYEIRIM